MYLLFNYPAFKAIKQQYVFPNQLGDFDLDPIKVLTISLL